jgi:hypothetical protein
MLSSRSFFPALLKVAAAVTLSAVALSAAVPRGWYITGSTPHDYESGIDDAQHNGHRVAYLKAIAETPTGFATLMQDFRANRYAGTRVRLRAALKTDQVVDWAGLWMRVDKVDGRTSRMVAFDNMYYRSIKGTNDWQDYDVVLDVPVDATNISFGISLHRSGKVLISDVSIKSVDENVPTTSFTAGEPARIQKPMEFHQPFEVPFNLELQP